MRWLLFSLRANHRGIGIGELLHTNLQHQLLAQRSAVTKQYFRVCPAIFGKVSDSNALIGSPDAPQVFGTHFYAANLGVMDGEHVGQTSLDPSVVGQQLSNDATIGIRANLSYRSPVATGLEFSGFWLGESDRSWQRGLGGFDAGDDPNNLRATALRWWNGIRCAVRSVLSNWFKDGSLRPWSRLRRRYFLAGSHAVSTNSRRSVCEHERRVRLSWSRQWSELHFGFDRWLSIRQIHRPWRFLPISRSLM